MNILDMVPAFVGLLMGGVAAWLFAKAKLRSEIGVLEERVASKDEQLRMSWGDVDALKAELLKAQQLFRQEAQLRLAAEQGMARAQILEKTVAARDHQITQMTSEQLSLKTQVAEQAARLLEMQKAVDEKVALINQARDSLAESFKTISAETLRAGTEAFLGMARGEIDKLRIESHHDGESRQKAVEELVKPLKESLDRVDQQIRDIEEKRVTAYSSMTHQLSSLAMTQERLQAETATLSKALKSPGTRGRWGEIQLKRVVEMAGMVEYCDFQDNSTAPNEDGVTKPDMILRLPGGRRVAIDTKAPFISFLESIEAREESVRATCLQNYAAQIRAHVTKLGSPGYWEQFGEDRPEFVCLFLPGETFYSAALEQDPSLIEFGVLQNVVVSTPTTLISLLRAVGYGWRQEKVAENAQKISELGRMLYERVRLLSEHFSRIGSGIESTIRAYNGAVGAFETRVVPVAAQFKELGATTGDELGKVRQIERTPSAVAKQNGRDAA
jgi:DNA recombination protein RmuC